MKKKPNINRFVIRIFCFAFLLCIAVVAYKTTTAKTDQQPIYYAQIKQDAQAVLAEEIYSVHKESFTIKQIALSLPGSGKANLWYAKPDGPSRGTIFHVAGSAVGDYSSTTETYARDGFTCYGLSWVDLDTTKETYPLLSGEDYSTELLLKGSAVALFALNQIPEEKITLIGSSNGGIISSILSNLSEKHFNIVYVVSSLNLARTDNNQLPAYEQRDAYLEQHIDTEKHNIFAILSTHDTFFPFPEVYPQLYAAAKGRIRIDHNLNHEISLVDAYKNITRIVELETVPTVSQPEITAIDAAHCNYSISWEGVENISYVCSHGDPRFGYYYPPNTPWALPAPTNVVVTGRDTTMQIPVSYYARFE